jgi:hypothetical protein
MADGIQVIVVIPENLIDLVYREQPGVVGNRTTPVEMKDL